MTTTTGTKLMRGLQRIALLSNGAGLTDGQLLDRFVGLKDELAFETLVRRHGPMVFAVCKRVGVNLQDAEDAFQACFLVLARKASSVLPREAVGNWLYGVAYRTARRARAVSARRSAREKQMMNMPHPTITPDNQIRELEKLLDQEISQLPDKYRLPLVLCELEGRSRREVARQLKLPEGTLSSRLATARKKLAARLTRRGIGLGSGALAAALAPNTASANASSSLVLSTARAAGLLGAGQATATAVISTRAAALADGVVKAMLVTKLKIGVTVFLVVAVAMGKGYSLLSPALQAEPLQEKRSVSEKTGRSLDHKSDVVSRPTVPVRKPGAGTPPTVPVRKTDDAKQPNAPGQKRGEQKPKEGRIRGRFTEDTGNPVAGAKLRVLIEGVPRESSMEEAISDADGSYVLQVPFGHCQLWGVQSPNGYFTQDRKTFGPILTTRAEPELVRNFLLWPGVSWHVELQGAEKAADKVPYFSAHLDREGGPFTSGEIVNVTGDEQSKAVLAIPSIGGRYRLACGLRTFPNPFEITPAKLEIDKYFDPQHIKGLPEPLQERKALRLLDTSGHSAVISGAEVFIEGTKAMLRFRAQPVSNALAFVFRGSVVDESGKPIEGAKFTAAFAFGNGSGMSTLEAKTDAQGNLLMRDVLLEQAYFKADSAVKMIVVKAGYDGAETRQISLLDVKKSGSGDFGKIVLKPGHTLRGRVIDGNGNPLQGAVITNRTNYFLYSHLRCRTDADGKFVMPDLSYGVQKLSVQFGERYANEDFQFGANNDFCIITLKPAPE